MYMSNRCGLSCYIPSCTVITCGKGFATSFVVFGHSHVRIECEIIIIVPCSLSRDLAGVRHTHVRVNIHHLQAYHMRIQRGKYLLLTFLRQDSVCRTERNVLETIEKM